MSKEQKRGPGRPKKDASERNAIVALSLSPETLERLDDQAEAENRSRSKVADSILLPALRRKQAKSGS
jgi:hypothetical protein